EKSDDFGGFPGFGGSAPAGGAGLPFGVPEALLVGEKEASFLLGGGPASPAEARPPRRGPG
ncbi:MAG: hypothetical protein V3V62_06245, partial [bacterium]